MPYLGQRPSKGDENNFKILDDISSYTLTFDGSDSSVVSAANDTITSLTHRFVQGQRVTYNKGGGTVITGLSDGVYYIIKEDHNTIKLATSASNASNGIAVNITGVGAGSSHTLNVAFDGVNTKFKATHTNGQKARITRSAQLVISMNGVIQQPHDTATPSTGFGFDLDGTIVFSQAPVSTDIFWAHVLTNNNVTFDISNNDIDNFTGDGSTTEFNLSKTPPDNRNVLVTVDGVVQYPNDPDGTARAYVVVENVLTFNSAPASSVEIQVRHIGFAGSTSGSSGVTNFYGRTGAVVLKNTDNITVNDATIEGDLTVNGDFTTLNTSLREVELLHVDATSSTAAGIITQRGSGDILNLYDNTTEVFSVEDGGKVKIGMGLLGTNTSDYDAAANNLIVGTGSGDEGITILSGQSVGHHGSIFFADGTGAINSKRGQIRYEQNSERMKFFTAGTQKLTIDINGKVGIGSDIPASKVDINATNSSLRIIKTSASNYCALQLDRDTSGTEGGYLGLAGGNTQYADTAVQHDLVLRSHSNLLFTSGGTTERLRIDSSGRLFTGGSSQLLDATVGALHISGGTSGGRLAFRGTTTSAEASLAEIFGFWDTNKIAGMIIKSGTDTTNKDDGSLHFYTRPDTATGIVERLRIDSNGQIGIGNITPDTWSTGHGLTIGTSQATLWGVGDQVNLSGNAYFNSGWKAAASKAGASQIEQALGNIDFKVSGSVTADNSITWINALRIKSDGKVGIGTDSPFSRLHISGSGAGQNTIRIDSSTTAISFHNHSQFMGFMGNDSGKLFINAGGTERTLSLRTVGVERLRINKTGNIGIGSTGTDQRLQVSGNIELSAYDNSNGSGGYYTSKGLIIGNAYDAGKTSTDDRTAIIWQERGLDLDIGVNNQFHTKFTYDGKVGIGTQIPAAKFVVSNAGANGFEFNPNFNSNNSIIASYNRTGGGSYSQLTLSASQHIFSQGGTEYGRFNASGTLVLKGDANPCLSLDRGSANSTNINLNYNSTFTGQISAANQEFQLSAVGASTPMAFYVNGDKRFHITTDGKFSLGTINTSPNAGVHIDIDTNNVLMLDNSTAATQKMFFAQNGGTHAQIYATSNSGALTIESDPSGNHNSSYMNFKVDGNTAMHIEAGGEIAIGNFSTPSRHLHIKDEGQIKLESTSTGGWTGLEFLGSSGTNNYDGYMGVQDSNGLFFIDNNSNGIDFCINRNGKVFIGADSTDFSDVGTFFNLRNNTYGGRIGFSNNTASSGATLMEQFAYWGTNKVAGFIAFGGTDTSNKDDGELAFYTRLSGASMAEALRIKDDGEIRIRGTKSGNSVPNVVLTFDILNSNGDSKKAEIKATKTADITSELIFSTTVSHTYDERLRIDSAGQLKHTRTGNSLLSTTSTDVGVVMSMQAISNPVGRVGTTSNHSTEVVANNVPAFSVNSSAEILASTKSFVSKFPDHSAEQLTGGWSTDWNTIISPGTLTYNDTYIISAYWQHDANGGNAGSPYLMQASFLFSSVSVNNSTGGNVEFIPFQTAHVGGGSHRLIFRMIPGTGHTTAGIQVKSASGFHADYGKITTKACRIADF